MAPADAFLQELDIDSDFIVPYYEALSRAYHHFHSTPLTYSLVQLKEDFKFAVLDFVRWVVPARLGGESPEKVSGWVGPRAGLVGKCVRKLVSGWAGE